MVKLHKTIWRNCHGKIHINEYEFSFVYWSFVTNITEKVHIYKLKTKLLTSRTQSLIPSHSRTKNIFIFFVNPGFKLLFLSDYFGKEKKFLEMLGKFWTRWGNVVDLIDLYPLLHLLIKFGPPPPGPLGDNF